MIWTLNSESDYMIEIVKSISAIVLLFQGDRRSANTGRFEFDLHFDAVRYLNEWNGAWLFDTKAGKQKMLYRRIGANELDAIQICRGYVEAQHEYALEKHDGSELNQYAQKVISTPGNTMDLCGKILMGL